MCSSLAFGQERVTRAQQQALQSKSLVETLKETSKKDAPKTRISKMQAEKMQQGKDFPLGNVYEPATRKAANAAPWKNGFDSSLDFKANWVSIDKDGDKKTWAWSQAQGMFSLDGSNKGGLAFSSYNSAANVKDFLITKNPVTLAAGAAYVVFAQTTSGAGFYEGVRVYYSKEFDTACDATKMTEIANWIDSTDGWKLRNLTFNVAEAGDYYIYIEHYTNIVDQYQLIIDNVEIGSGTFTGEPKLQWQSAVMPISSCDLGEETIGFVVRNAGSGDLANFKVKYVVNGGIADNGGMEVEETFAGPVKPYETKSFTFTTKANLSSSGNPELAADKAGKKYGIEFKAGDKVLDECFVTNFNPTQALPYVADMSVDANKDFVMDFDTMVGYDAYYWVYDTNEWALNAQKTGAPLVTRCMNLKANTQYRIGLDYKAGYLFSGIFLVTDDFNLLYGKVGTPISEWDTLNFYEGPYTEEKFMIDEYTVEPEEDGAYAFAVVQRVDSVYPSQMATWVRSIKVEKILEHDIRISKASSTLGIQTPIRHITTPQFSALVENRGYSDEAGIKVTAKNGEAAVGEVALDMELSSADDTVMTLDGTLSNLVADRTVTVEFTAGMTSTDMNPADNKTTWKFTPTDGLYAFDKDVAKFTNGIGHATYHLGQIFPLMVPDTLTEIVVGWYDFSDMYEEGDDFPVGLEVYPVNEDGLGQSILSYDFNRQIAGGYQTIKVPARALNAGYYFVALRQAAAGANYAVGYDEAEDGLVYVYTGQQFAYAEGYGNMALRIKLGHPEKLVAKDIELLSMSKPRESGQFTANEAVEVNYINNGVDDMEVNFNCTVDGVAIDTKTVKVKGYAMGKVKFTVDLSKAGLHDIKVEAVVNGDENPNNNAVAKTVKTIYPTPYEMNFEFCADFAIDGDLAPWKGVDIDGDSTYGLSGISWPNAYGPQSYIAFNAATVGVKVGAPHNGDRCGVVFASTKKQNDDWLISPQLALPKDGTTTLSFYVNSMIDAYGTEYVELYEIYVSETDNQIASFKKLGDTRETVPGTWTRVEEDLSAYNGKQIHVGIRCLSTDQWMFMIDDIEVSNPMKIEQTDNLAAYVKSYPNPVSDVWTVSTFGVEINKVEIFNTMGAMVHSTANNLKTNGWRLNMSGFKSGLYTARVYTNAGVQTIKVTVK